MYFIDEKQNIHINRGDELNITLSNSTASFSQGDQLKFSIMKKGDASAVVLQKTFTVDERCSKFLLTLTSQDTKLENIIKTGTVVYWYEIEYNGINTLIGYDMNGPKEFILYPEAADLNGEG